MHIYIDIIKHICMHLFVKINIHNVNKTPFKQMCIMCWIYMRRYRPTFIYLCEVNGHLAGELVHPTRGSCLPRSRDACLADETLDKVPLLLKVRP